MHSIANDNDEDEAIAEMPWQRRHIHTMHSKKKTYFTETRRQKQKKNGWNKKVYRIYVLNNFHVAFVAHVKSLHPYDAISLPQTNPYKYIVGELHSYKFALIPTWIHLCARHTHIHTPSNKSARQYVGCWESCRIQFDDCTCWTQLLMQWLSYTLLSKNCGEGIALSPNYY